MSDPTRRGLSLMRRMLGRDGGAEGAAGTLGHLDVIEGPLVRGWAYDPAKPDRRIRVAVRVDGRTVAEEVADLPRPDLAAGQYGDGRHGFAVTLPLALLDGRAHSIQVVDAETDVRLHARMRRQRLEPILNARQICLDVLFDPAFYQAQAGACSYPLDHYRETGWRKGFDPHPLFSTRHYLALYGAAVPADPLSHFAETGQWQGAWTHPLLDRPEPEPTIGTAEPKRHPVLAYLVEGEPAEHPLSRHFDGADYVARYPGVTESGIAPLSHYLIYGWREGKRPHPDFDPALYAELFDLAPKQEPYTHFVRRLEAPPRPAAAPAHPAVSVIVLNLDKSVLTLQCLQLLADNTDLSDVEVIVVDNGSSPGEFGRLARWAHGVTLVRLGANRGFGEANNIAAEHACGALLVFLNNDAFVRPGWLAPLRAALAAHPEAGAAGAKLLFPDGRLQEAGATISLCGTAVQRGKHLDPGLPVFNRIEPVDYCSAAALMVRAESFRRALGFDLCWDPAYYEDADLCLKLRAMGQSTLYVPESEVVHLEHATSADRRLSLRLDGIVAVNRLKFVSRWGDVLAGLPGAEPPGTGPEPRPRDRHADPRPRAALYSPYPLTPGGGERYLLTMAETLGRDYACTLVTPDRYSRLRLLTLGRDLGLDLDALDPAQVAEGSIDLFVCMANELLPPVRGLGRTNLYHCQFPFPMSPEHYGRAWNNLASYQGVVVNSRFTAEHYAAAGRLAGVAIPPVHVLSPPVPQAERSVVRSERLRILSIGRFAPGGHCKHQNLMVAEFTRLLELCKEAGLPTPELHLAGSVGSEPDARAYFGQTVAAARALPVFLHPNATPQRIAALLSQADLYWHLTGAGEDVARHPERFEHFGIALSEAMSAGAVPVALGRGGPREIVTHERDGVLIDGIRDLVPETLHLLRDPRRRERLGLAARQRAAAFAPGVFAEELRRIVAAYRADPALAITAHG